MNTCAAILSQICLNFESQLLIYALIALVMILEGEIFLLVAGSLVALGFLKLIPLLIAAILGSWLSDIFWYWLGRRYGENLIKKYGRWFLITPERFFKIERIILSNGFPFIFLSKFFYGFYHLCILAAGAANFNFKKFLKFQMPVSFFWALLFVFLGKIFAFSLSIIEKDIKMLGLGIISFIILIITLEWIFRKTFLRKFLNGNKNQP